MIIQTHEPQLLRLVASSLRQGKERPRMDMVMKQQLEDVLVEFWKEHVVVPPGVRIPDVDPDTGYPYEDDRPEIYRIISDWSDSLFESEEYLPQKARIYLNETSASMKREISPFGDSIGTERFTPNTAEAVGALAFLTLLRHRDRTVVGERTKGGPYVTKCCVCQRPKVITHHKESALCDTACEQNHLTKCYSEWKRGELTDTFSGNPRSRAQFYDVVRKYAKSPKRDESRSMAEEMISLVPKT